MIIKNKILKKEKIKELFILFVILLLGISIRLFLIKTRNIFNDEFFYFNIAKNSSIIDIIKIKHWIKDHGILYYIFIKTFINVTKDIQILRLSNIILYLISSLFIFFNFKKLISNKFSFIMLILYSFNIYFIYLNSWISPFNLVSFFTIFSIISLINIYLIKNFKNKKKYYLIFILSSILGFYSDYSFIYVFFLYALFTILFFLKNKKLFLKTINFYILILIFIFPGIFQFVNNLKTITNIFENTFSQHNITNYLETLKIISSLLLNRHYQNFSFFLIIFLIFFNIYIFIEIKNKKLIKLNIIFIFFFLINTLIIYLSSKYFIYLLIERSFWFLNLNLIFILSINFFIFTKKFKKFELILYFLIIMYLFFNIYKYKNINLKFHSLICEETKYYQLINNLSKIMDKKYIFIIDQGYHFIPLYYYFNYFDNEKNKIYQKIYKIKKTSKIEFIKEKNKKIEEIIKKEKNKVILITLNIDQSFLNDILKLNNKNLNIYTLNQLNNCQFHFYKWK